MNDFLKKYFFLEGKQKKKKKKKLFFCGDNLRNAPFQKNQ